MPEVGNRTNVIGPYPIGHRAEPPYEMRAAAERILALLAEGNRAELLAMATEEMSGEIAALAETARAGCYDKREILATARVNQHYFVKGRLVGPGVEPLLFQVRLGQRDGRWMIWDVMNLSGRRSAWSR